MSHLELAFVKFNILRTKGPIASHQQGIYRVDGDINQRWYLCKLV